MFYIVASNVGILLEKKPATFVLKCSEKIWFVVFINIALFFNNQTLVTHNIILFNKLRMILCIFVTILLVLKNNNIVLLCFFTVNFSGFLDNTFVAPLSAM